MIEKVKVKQSGCSNASPYWGSYGNEPSVELGLSEHDMELFNKKAVDEK